MRLALDATPLLATPTGVGVFTHEIIERLARVEDVELVLFAVSWRGRRGLAGLTCGPATVVTRPMAARPLRAAWRRHDLPPIEWWTGPVDVVHGPNFVVPPSRRALEVATVHDLTCVRFPNLCTPDTLAYPDLVKRALSRGAILHAVSEFVAIELRELLGAPDDLVVTVPNGIAPGSPGDAAAGRSLAGTELYVLSIGTEEPRKDLPTLVWAFDELAYGHPDLHLVHAGQPGWGSEGLDEAIAASSFSDRIHRLGWVTDKQRADLLAGAAVFAYPSVYEGFGMPPLEAMAAGTPVVTTDAGALPDTVGDAALIVPVGDPAALAESIEEVLDNEQLADRLRDSGTHNLMRFSWDRTVAGLIDLYRSN